QDGAGAGRPRAERGAKDTARRDSGAQKFSIEPLRNQVGHRHWGPAQQAKHVFLSQTTESPTGLEQIPHVGRARMIDRGRCDREYLAEDAGNPDRKSTRLNSSHGSISYAVFCLKKKKKHRKKNR